PPEPRAAQRGTDGLRGAGGGGHEAPGPGPAAAVRGAGQHPAPVRPRRRRVPAGLRGDPGPGASAGELAARVPAGPAPDRAAGGVKPLAELRLEQQVRVLYADVDGTLV